MKKKKTSEEDIGTKQKTLSPFDFINSINGGASSKNLMEDCAAFYDDGASQDGADRSYVPFMINRGLSYFNDTILFANEMNRHASLPPKMQYDFLRNCIRPRKRFSKWSKRADDSDDIKLLMLHYQCNSQRAREISAFYPADELDKLKKMYDRGGKV